MSQQHHGRNIRASIVIKKNTNRKKNERETDSGVCALAIRQWLVGQLPTLYLHLRAHAGRRFPSSVFELHQISFVRKPQIENERAHGTLFVSRILFDDALVTQEQLSLAMHHANYRGTIIISI